jgi:hypothetical protein
MNTEDIKIEGVQISTPNLPIKEKLFMDTLKFMTEAETTKTLENKEAFVITMVLKLYPSLTPFEITIATQMIKLIISAVIQISHNPALVKKINETFCCCFR